MDEIPHKKIQGILFHHDQLVLEKNLVEVE
jgi:hypothetical protein